MNECRGQRVKVPEVKSAFLFIYRGTPSEVSEDAIADYLQAALQDPAYSSDYGLLKKFMKSAPSKTLTNEIKNAYESMWSRYGSPALQKLIGIAEQAGANLKKDVLVMPALLYGKPSLRLTMRSLKAMSIAKVYLVPFYPQLIKGDYRRLERYFLTEAKAIDYRPELHTMNLFYADGFFEQQYGEFLRKHIVAKEESRYIFRFPALARNCLEDIVGDESPSNYQENCQQRMYALANAMQVPVESCSISFFKPLLGGENASPQEEPLQNAKDQKNALIHASYIIDDIDTNVENDSGFAVLPCLNDDATFVEHLSTKIREIVRDKQ